MKTSEYIKTVVYKDKMINIGLDDAGQTFFIEYVENGELKEECVGPYCSEYEDYLDYRFGEPSDCPHYTEYVGKPYPTKCKYKVSKPDCSMCPQCCPDNTVFEELLAMGLVDRRGNPIGTWIKMIEVKNDSTTTSK